jgi:hypothetical protein
MSRASTAVLILPMQFGPFDHDAQIQVAGDANVKRACMAAENVDVAAEMLAVLILGPRERPWRVPQVRASVVEKARTAWAR